MNVPKDDLLKKLDEKISEQNAKIEKLESIISIHENTIDQLLVKCEDNEQYSRRSCLRIHGKKRKGKKSEGDAMNMLEQCCSGLDVPFNPNDIDRAHRIRLSCTDNHSEKKVKCTIVKFRSWEARQLFYKSRPRYHTYGSKKPGFPVSIGLTKQRYLLMSKAKGLVKGKTNISYIYNDINCSLALKFKDNSFKYFNSEKELKLNLDIRSHWGVFFGIGVSFCCFY